MGEKGLNALAQEAGYIVDGQGQIHNPNDQHVEEQFNQGLEHQEPWTPVASAPENIKPDTPDVVEIKSDSTSEPEGPVPPNASFSGNEAEDVVDIKGDSTYSQPDAPNSQTPFSGVGGLDALGGAIADSIEPPPVLPPAFDQSDGNELPPGEDVVDIEGDSTPPSDDTM